MDYQKIRQRLEANTERPVSDRQILSVIACALLDIGETLTHMSRVLDQLDSQGKVTRR